LRYPQNESMAGPGLERAPKRGLSRLGTQCCPGPVPENSAAVERHIGKGDMMKSVMAGEDRKERRRDFRLRLFTLAAGLYVCALLLLAGCATRQPGQTASEVQRRHQRIGRLNSDMMMADIDKFLLFDKPSMLTDRRVP